ncbi:MAG TPA: flagellar hook-basal body complex protein FliE [Solirubrobacteraceae bacterium]|nr:flagellar hook-basal body complex protein FliE [Solirubrobacteraceae bacterium]
MIVPAIGAIGQAAANQISTSQQGAGQLEGIGQGAPAGAAEPTLGGAAGAGPGNGFSGALTEAISSLEKTQQSGDSAARGLATGTVSDPQSAVVTVQDAQLAMQLAAQIRTKAVEAATNIFQTQV